MSRLSTLIFVVWLAAAVLAPQDASASSGCGASGTSGSGGVLITGVCARQGDHPIAPSSPLPPTQTVFCGRPSSAANGLWNRQCGAPRFCFDTVTDPGKKSPEDAYATLIQQGGAWVLQSVWCPATARPIPTTAALREQALRLLPKVSIGSAWATRALVHAQTILWADTTPTRTLPTVTVVGRQVTLRLRLDHATWDFGDTTHTTTTDPGHPYDRTTDPCKTAQCPGYFGHTYTRTGPTTITLTIAWHAQFSLDNGTTWTDIDPAPLTGPTTTHHLTLIQARGILVPTP